MLGSETRSDLPLVECSLTNNSQASSHLATAIWPHYPHRSRTIGWDGCTRFCQLFHTWLFHDWCVENNFVRISGEDHYSGLKSPRQNNGVGVGQWGWTKYPYLEFGADYPATYGIYSETPDFMPLIGKTDPSCVCYMVGCNAWGKLRFAAAALAAPSWATETCPKQSSAPQISSQSVVSQHANWQGLWPL